MKINRNFFTKISFCNVFTLITVIFLKFISHKVV